MSRRVPLNMQTNIVQDTFEINIQYTKSNINMTICQYLSDRDTWNVIHWAFPWEHSQHSQQWINSKPRHVKSCMCNLWVQLVECTDESHVPNFLPIAVCIIRKIVVELFLQYQKPIWKLNMNIIKMQNDLPSLHVWDSWRLKKTTGVADPSRFMGKPRQGWHLLPLRFRTSSASYKAPYKEMAHMSKNLKY